MNTKFEFAGIIPSVNETKFDDPIIEDETFGIVKTFEEWKEWKIETIKDRYASGYDHEFRTLYDFMDDFDGIEYLSSRMKFGGFMVAPAALLNGKPISSKTHRLMAYNYLNDFIESYSDRASNIYLYDLTFYPALPDYKIYTSSTGETPLISPTFHNDMGHWKIRFGTAE